MTEIASNLTLPPVADALSIDGQSASIAGALHRLGKPALPIRANETENSAHNEDGHNAPIDLRGPIGLEKPKNPLLGLIVSRIAKLSGVTMQRDGPTLRVKSEPVRQGKLRWHRK